MREDKEVFEMLFNGWKKVFELLCGIKGESCLKRRWDKFVIRGNLEGF